MYKKLRHKYYKLWESIFEINFGVSKLHGNDALIFWILLALHLVLEVKVVVQVNFSESWQTSVGAYLIRDDIAFPLVAHASLHRAYDVERLLIFVEERKIVQVKLILILLPGVLRPRSAVVNLERHVWRSWSWLGGRAPFEHVLLLWLTAWYKISWEIKALKQVWLLEKRVHCSSSVLVNCLLLWEFLVDLGCTARNELRLSKLVDVSRTLGALIVEDYAWGNYRSCLKQQISVLFEFSLFRIWYFRDHWRWLLLQLRYRLRLCDLNTLWVGLDRWNFWLPIHGC